MTSFIYDFCLLYKVDFKGFISDVIGMQTDDILYETIEAFVKQKDEAIKSADNQSIWVKIRPRTTE